MFYRLYIAVSVVKSIVKVPQLCAEKNGAQGRRFDDKHNFSQLLDIIYYSGAVRPPCKYGFWPTHPQLRSYIFLNENEMNLDSFKYMEIISSVYLDNKENAISDAKNENPLR